MNRALLSRAWLRLGLVEAALVLGGFFYILLSNGWSLGLGAPTGPGTPLHDTCLAAATMTFAGITAC